MNDVIKNLKFNGFQKLNDYLDRNPNEDIFSKEAIGMAVEGLKDIETRGILAVTTAAKQQFQESAGKDITLDVFQQGLRLIRKSNFLLSWFMIIANAEVLLDNPNNTKPFEMFVSEKMIEILSYEDSLCKLMTSIIHTMKDDKPEKN